MTSRSTLSAENLITCGICHQQLVDPRLLPCSHTYCLQCIRADAEAHGGQFECPRQDRTKVQQNFIDALPVNQTIRDVTGFLAFSSGQIRCSNCNSQTSDEWCIECANNYCADCSRTLHRMPALRRHQLLSLRDKPTEWLACGAHTDEKLKHWCERCAISVCSDCLLNTHKDHPYTSILNVTRELQAKINRDLSRIEVRLCEKAEESGGILADIDDVHQRNKQMIRELMGLLREVINQHETEMCTRIETIETGEKTQMEDYHIRLRNELESLRVQKETLEILLRSNDQMKLLRARQGFLAYIDRVNQILTGLRMPTRREYTVERVDEGPQLREKILQCGRVRESLRLTTDGAVYRNPQLEKYITSHQTKQQWDIRMNTLTNLDMAIIANALENNTTLTELRLVEAQIDDQGVEQLATAVRANRTLTILSLYGNQISDYGLQHLIDALQRNNVLTTLDLCENRITDQRIEHLAQMLSRNQTLTTLHLSRNLIGDQGAQHLADTLRGNRTLLILHLSQCQIGEQGARYLADALTENRALTTLNLYSNQIGDRGARSLAEALERNRTLNTLYLAENRIGNNGAKDLVDALQRNTTLTTLSLHQNQIDEQTQQQSSRILRSIPDLTVSW